MPARPEELRWTPSGACERRSVRLRWGLLQGREISAMELNQLIWLVGVGIVLLIAAILGGIV